MIEIGVNGLGLWAWTMISSSGRTLVYREGYATEGAALRAARRYRAALFVAAASADHRQGACI